MLANRMTISRCGAMALLAMCLALAAPAQDWKTYSYAADGFSAAYPADPDISKKDVPTGAGAFELRSYMTIGSEATLFVGVCDYGPAMTGSDPEKQLQGAKNGALVNSAARLIREKKISLGPHLGLEFESESATAHFYTRLYMVDATLYQTLVVTKIGEPYSDTLRFLDSFQLIARVR